MSVELVREARDYSQHSSSSGDVSLDGAVAGGVESRSVSLPSKRAPEQKRRSPKAEQTRGGPSEKHFRTESEGSPEFEEESEGPDEAEGTHEDLEEATVEGDDKGDDLSERLREKRYKVPVKELLRHATSYSKDSLKVDSLLV